MDTSRGISRERIEYWEGIDTSRDSIERIEYREDRVLGG
jgi:hypothetical protein